MGEKRRVLFLFPIDWTTSPRSEREVLLLKNSGYETTVLSTNIKYVIRCGMGVPSSPPFYVSSQEVRNYRIPFFVAPLILLSPKLFFKICFLVFYLVSALAYVVSLFFLTLVTCVTERVNLIHVHNAPDLAGLVAFLVSRVLRIPYVFEVHDLTPELYAETMNLPSDSIVFKILKRIEGIVILNSSGNIFVSKAMQHHFESTYNLGHSKSVVMYSGWTRDFLELFKYSEHELDSFRREKSLEDKFIILYLGSMEDGFRRGLDILVESAHLLVHDYKFTNVMLVFIGGDDQRMISKLSQLSEDLSISDNVSFQGKLPRQEAYKWLQIANVLVDPLRSVASTEIAVSNKDLEYMAAQRTIIASDLAGHRETFQDGYTGFLFRNADPRDLADKIRFLIDNADNIDIQKFGINAGKDFREKYCWEIQQPKLLDVYSELLY